MGGIANASWTGARRSNRLVNDLDTLPGCVLKKRQVIEAPGLSDLAQLGLGHGPCGRRRWAREGRGGTGRLLVWGCRRHLIGSGAEKRLLQSASGSLRRSAPGLEHLEQLGTVLRNPGSGCCGLLIGQVPGSLLELPLEIHPELGAVQGARGQDMCHNQGPRSAAR